MKQLISLAFCFLVSTAHAFPTPGIYWNPDESGTGYSIDVQQNLIAIAIYTYQENGDSIWYLAAGTMTDKNRRFTGPTREFIDGQCPGCPYQPPISPGGKGILSLQFTSRDNALLTWQGRTIPIERQNFGFASGPGSMLGRWLFIAETSRGYTDTVDYTFESLGRPSGAPGGTGTFIAPRQRAIGECFNSGELEGLCLVAEVGTGSTVRRSYVFEQELDQALGSRVDLNTGNSVEMVGYQLLPNPLLVPIARARAVQPDADMIEALLEAAELVERP